jgi:hypothetical protein
LTQYDRGLRSAMSSTYDNDVGLIHPIPPDFPVDLGKTTDTSTDAGQKTD